jgi:adenylate cyclase
MALEIERKFLVRDDSWRRAVTRSLPMRQGYLGGEGGAASVRVRLEGDAARLNIKASVVGSARAEFEYPLPPADARALLEMCVGVLQKTRHFVPHAGMTWEVDEFIGANAGLVVAEIELPAPDHVFAHPAWLGREVTDDRRYYNHHLALHPFTTWK